MIAALAAAQLLAAAGPARAEEPAAQERETGTPGQARFAEGVEIGMADGQAAEPQVGGEPSAAPREDKPRKRKSTGDKVLTGAAVVLGVGALAVGGLLIAIFVQ